MNVVLDAGNTRIKVAHFERNKLLHSYLVNDLAELKKKWPLQENDRALLSNVGSWNLESLALPKSTVWLSPETPLPLKLRYKTPQTLGNDRRALAVAACKEYKGKPVLVVDAGTCITYDLVTEAGEYLGGAIAPGLAMRYQALHEHTANLPRLSAPNTAIDLIGNSTQNSLHSGVVLGFTAEVEMTIERYKERYENLVVVLTGGDVNRFAHFTKNGIFARPNFLLKGLNYILEYNA